MSDLSVVVYTMKGCPFCTDFKEMLTNEGIEFFDRDIDDYKDEYDIFVEVTDNDMIPAMLIIEGNDEKHESFLYAPERNYNELSEAVDIIQGHRQKLGLI
jgi:glutaredoxin